MRTTESISQPGMGHSRQSWQSLGVAASRSTVLRPIPVDLEMRASLFRRHYIRMSERRRDCGYAVVLVDYLTAEGVANTCGGEISYERVGEYVGASLAFVQDLPNTDPERLSCPNVCCERGRRPARPRSCLYQEEAPVRFECQPSWFLIGHSATRSGEGPDTAHSDLPHCIRFLRCAPLDIPKPTRQERRNRTSV